MAQRRDDDFWPFGDQDEPLAGRPAGESVLPDPEHRSSRDRRRRGRTPMPVGQVERRTAGDRRRAQEPRTVAAPPAVGARSRERRRLRDLQESQQRALDVALVLLAIVVVVLVLVTFTG